MQVLSIQPHGSQQLHALTLLSDAEIDEVGGSLGPLGTAGAGAVFAGATYLATTPSSNWSLIGFGPATLYGGLSGALGFGTGFSEDVFGGGVASFDSCLAGKACM